MELQLHSFGWRVLVALSTTVGLPVTMSAAATLAATSDDGNAVADTSLPCAPTRQAAELLVHGTEMHSRALQSYLSGSSSRPVTLRSISFH